MAETVRRVRQRLGAVFDDAVFHGRATPNPAQAVRRKLREATPKRGVRGKFAALPFGEAPALMDRLQAMPGTAARALDLAILTAARSSEVLLAEWSEIDLQAGVWTLPPSKMKAAEVHVVYLSPRALDVVRAQIDQDSRLVFPSPVTMARPDGLRRPLSNMAMLAVLDRLGMRQSTTVHGLCRATFSTWANETGASRPDDIEACLAHEESNRVRAAYNRAQFNDERRSLLAAWANYLAQPPAPVLMLRSA